MFCRMGDRYYLAYRHLVKLNSDSDSSVTFCRLGRVGGVTDKETEAER